MKKTFFKIVLVLVLIAIVGCGNEKTDKLKVGMDLRFYPFTGTNKEGKPVGVEVDIAKELAKYLGKEVEIINTEFSMLIPALQSEEIDIIIGSMSITEEREKTVDFSNPYMYDKIVALINKEFADKNKVNDNMSLEDFFNIKDMNFIGIIGSIAVSIPESYDFKVKVVTTDAVAEREIVTGNADALVGTYTLYGMNATNKNTTIMYKNPIEYASTGMAVKEGNKELLEKVNKFIATLETSGLNNQLRKDWDQAIKEKLFNDTLTLDYYLKLDQ